MIEVTTGHGKPTSGPLRNITEYRGTAGLLAEMVPAGSELISLLLEGSLDHRDNAGQLIHLHAGSLHYQATGADGRSSLLPGQQPLHLVQCLLEPDTKPEPHQTHEALPDGDGRLRLIASPDGRRGRLRIGANTAIYYAELGEGDTPAHNLERGHQAWLYLVSGHVFACGAEMKTGDSALVRDDAVIAVYAQAISRLLLFDWPAPHDRP